MKTAAIAATVLTYLVAVTQAVDITLCHNVNMDDCEVIGIPQDSCCKLFILPTESTAPIISQ